jgi:hypothetical protein
MAVTPTKNVSFVIFAKSDCFCGLSIDIHNLKIRSESVQIDLHMNP